MLIINGDTVRAALPMSTAIDVMRSALRAFAGYHSSEVIVPVGSPQEAAWLADHRVKVAD